MEEGKYEIELIDGEKVTIGLRSSVYNQALAEGEFVKLGFSPGSLSKIICIWQSLDAPVIIMFEVGDDSVYRIVLDISIMVNGAISIEKKMKDGSSRRTDVNICF